MRQTTAIKHLDMKKIPVFIISCLIGLSAFTQFTYKIKADSLLLTKDTCNAELIIENGTRNVKGFLYNTGNGRTVFTSGSIKLTDSTYLIGSDTLKTRSGLSNPMTTAGDIIVGGSSGTPTRLALGLSYYALMNNGGTIGYGLPYWNGAWASTIIGDLNGATLSNGIMGVTHTGGTASMTLSTGAGNNSILEIVNIGSGNLTVNRNGSEQIYYHGTNVTSFVLTPGQSINLRSFSRWVAMTDGYASTGASNLQQVTDAGSTTTNPIISSNLSGVQVTHSTSNLIGMIANSSGTDFGGSLYFKDLHTANQVFLYPNGLTATRSITFPNASGTIALTSDLATAQNLQQVTNVGNTTANNIIVSDAAIKLMAVIKTGNVGSDTYAQLGSSMPIVGKGWEGYLQVGDSSGASTQYSVNQIKNRLNNVLHIPAGVGTDTLALLSDIRSGIPSTPNLQQVTDIANTTSNELLSGVGYTVKIAGINYSRLLTSDIGGGNVGGGLVLKANTSSNNGVLYAPTLSTVRSWALPNANGTIALTSDIPGAPSGSITSSGYTMSTARLLGRTTASTGAVEEITVNSPLTFSSAALGIQNAAADGTTKGAASFAGNDFDASSGNITIDYTNGQKASSSIPGFATINQTIGTIGLTVDGQGATVSTGSKGFITIPYNCTIAKWFVSASASGSIQFDIKRSGTSIVGSGNKPLLSSAQSGNATASGWTSVSVSEGDILEWVIDSATTITNATVVLKVFK